MTIGKNMSTCKKRLLATGVGLSAFCLAVLALPVSDSKSNCDHPEDCIASPSDLDAGGYSMPSTISALASTVVTIQMHGEQIAEAHTAMITRSIEQYGKYLDGLVTTYYELEDKRLKLETYKNHEPNVMSCQTSGGKNAMIVAERTAEKRVARREAEANMIQDNSPGSYGEKGTMYGATNAAMKRRTFYCNYKAYNEYREIDIEDGDFSSPLVKACDTFGLSGDEKEKFIDGDRSPYRTLFGNSYLDEEENEIANDMIELITRPFVPDPLRGPILASPDGLVLERTRSAAIARTNLAAGVFQGMKEIRLASQDNQLGDWVKSMNESLLEGTSSSTRAEMEEAFDLDKDDASLYQVMEIMYSKRLNHPYYMQWVQSLTPTNAVREMVNLMSLKLMLQWEQYRIMERIIAMDATDLSISMENSNTGFQPNVGGGGGRGNIHDQIHDILDKHDLIDRHPELQEAMNSLDQRVTTSKTRQIVPAPSGELIAQDVVANR